MTQQFFNPASSLRAQYRTDNPLDRLQACEDMSLAADRDPEVLKLLCEALNDADPEVRAAAKKAAFEAGPALRFGMRELAQAIMQAERWHPSDNDLYDARTQLYDLAFTHLKDPCDYMPMIEEFRRERYNHCLAPLARHFHEKAFTFGKEFEPLVRELITAVEPEPFGLFLAGTVLAALSPAPIDLTDRLEELMNGCLSEPVESILLSPYAEAGLALGDALEKLAPEKAAGNQLLKEGRLAAADQNTYFLELGEIKNALIQAQEEWLSAGRRFYTDAQLRRSPDIDALLDPEMPPFRLIPGFKGALADITLPKKRYLPQLIAMFKHAKQGVSELVEKDDEAQLSEEMSRELLHVPGVIERAVFAAARMRPAAPELVPYLVPVIKGMVESCDFTFAEAFDALQRMAKYAASAKHELIQLRSVLAEHRNELEALQSMGEEFLSKRSPDSRKGEAARLAGLSWYEALKENLPKLEQALELTVRRL